MTSENVKRRIQSNSADKDFFSYILANNYEERLTDIELTMLASTFIVAGSGTAAGGLAGILPCWVLGKGEFIEDQWVLGGYAVGVNQLAAGYSEVNFHRTREFLPERWLDIGPDSEFLSDDRMASQPFSLGSRNCVGKLMANAEMALTFVMLLWNFDPELDDLIENWWLKGCLRAPLEPSNLPFGIDTLLASLRADRDQRTPDYVVNRFAAMGVHTFRMSILGTTNLFNDFSMGVTRSTNLKTVLGRSIFAADGASWRAARDMMRPLFSRDNVSQLDLLEAHVQALFQYIKKDNSTTMSEGIWSSPVSLAALLPSLTLDSATELFLG
ncbi:cytochrome P450 monooxygenase [Fusarium coicis]|nr:cytochrome P450 monooxygenase [Fusarium coicis]